MTAPLFNLPITAPITGGAAANPAGQSALGGFEALLAAFFGGEAQDAAAGLFGSAVGKSEPQAADETKSEPEADKDAPVDPLAMAAMLLTTPAPVAAAAVAVAVADAALSGKDGEKANTAPAAQAFAAPAVEDGLESATAPSTGETPEAPAAATGQPAEAALTETLAPVGKPVETKAGSPTEKPSEPKPAHEPKAAQHAAATPTPAPAAQPHNPLTQAKEAPAPQTLALAEAAVAASEGEAQAAERVETPANPAPRAGRHADAARRSNSAGEAVSVAPPADDAVLPNAVTGVATADAAGEPAASVEAEIAVPTPAAREAKPEAGPADKPDFQLPAQASAVAHAHSNAVAAHSQQVRATSETVANLTAQMSKKLEGRSTKFDVELTPAGLGQVNIAVEIAASGKMTAAMSFETPQAAAELRARAHELQRALEQAGFDLSGGLSFDVAGDQGRQAQQQQQQHDGAAWRGRAFQAVLGTAGEAAETAATAALAYTRRSDTGVDVRI